jgi:Uma2 family endonuclease
MSVQKTVETRVGMPMEEFVRLYEQEGPFELVNGERISIVPHVVEHSEITKGVYGALFAFEQAERTVIAYFETPFVLADTPDWVTGSRVPDVMVYRAERIAAYKAQTPDWKKKPYVLVPDLCIEVISPNDIYLDVDEKVDLYLADGVRLIWVFNPRKRNVKTYKLGSNEFMRLSENEILDGGEILPGFKLLVKDIFPKDE